MKEKRINRRNVLKSLGSGALACLTGSCFSESLNAQEKWIPPTELCTHNHFKQLPRVMKGHNGKLFYRQNGNIYQAREGSKMAVDGSDHSLSGDYEFRQERWEDSLKKRDLNFPLRAEMDEYPFDLFKDTLGSKWDCLTDFYQEKTKKAWPKLSKKLQRIAFDTYDFGAYFSFNKFLANNLKTSFLDFDKAYQNLLTMGQSASQRIFKTRDGSVTKDYAQNYPWVCINYPNVDDRFLIFAHECLSNKRKRFNLENIEKYSH